ncbi:MAG: NmrA family NAD(P)-binding protein [Ktedonobacteraceae bacterium]|nr:NmrA family NAD(P)-binding protein [Ktedonobacteraceae bacterium]
MTQITPTILVTGAAGRVGGTGRMVVEALLERGYAVRAFVRTSDRRAKHLETLGAELFVGDLLDFQAVRAALQGIKRAYFCYPVSESLLEAAIGFAALAQDGGLEAIVDLSQGGADVFSTSPAARQHGLVERALDWANVGVIHLRASFFADNLLIFAAPTIVSQGTFSLPYLGNAGSALVAAEDIARVAVALLEDPQPHFGKTYSVTGPTVLFPQEIAQTLSDVLHRPVTYTDLSIEDWQKLLGFTLSSHLTQHFAASGKARSVQQSHGSPARVPISDTISDTVRRLTSREPVSLETFIRTHAQAFGGIPSA